VRTRAAASVAAAAVVAGGCGGEDAGRPPQVFAVSVPAALRPAEFATGFAAGDGRVVTVDHVLAGARAVRVGARPARVLRERAQVDLAALAVPGVRAPALRTAGAAAGDAVTVRVLRGGSVRLLRGRVRRTITAHVRPAPDARAVVRPGLELAVAVQRGDSGAPVLDERERVVGIVFAQAADRDDLAYAVSASALPAVLR
jgi:S1-C subfamily serine protease